MPLTIKNFHLALFLTFLPYLLLAQNYKGSQEISVSYGMGSGMSLYIWNSSTIASSNSEADYWDAISSSGNILVSYKYFFRNNSAIGISAGTQNMYVSLNNELTYFYGTAHYNSKVVALEFTQNYIEKNHWTYYGLLDLGLAFNKTIYDFNQNSFIGNTLPNSLPRDNGTFLAYQVTPIGFKYAKRLGWFLELGLGYKGLINTGILLNIGEDDNIISHKRRWWN